MSLVKAQKRQRAARACDFCHLRGLRCRRALADTSQVNEVGCLTCKDYSVQCTLDRPVRRRGRKPTAARSTVPTPISSSSEDSCLISPDTVRQLTRVYCDNIYHCYFPFLTETDLLTRWEDGVPDTEGPSYLLLITVCAVSSQTAALGAVFDEDLLEDLPLHDSELYYSEAVARIPTHIGQSQDLDYLRSFGLLAVYCLQSGNHSDLHRYLGLCHALVAQHGFHDEHRWPADLSLSDVDDRRRMFWCLYRLEVHSACTYGHIVRMPESQASVSYPRITPAMDPETQMWTAGWDYITDLFRLLEYAIFSLRGCKTRKPLLAMFCSVPSPTMLLDSLSQLKGGKPRVLQDLTSLQDASHSNRCQYMAVQILCTETLVTIMSLLYCQASANEIMEVAKSFLDEVTKAPLIMFRIAGSQIVHQLLGVGHMIFNASYYDHGRYWPEAKRLLALLGDLVKTLENDIPSAVEAGERFLRLADSKV